MYKYHNHILPSIFYPFFISVRNIHNYNTRLSRLELTQGVKIWNIISDEDKLLSLNQFKNKLKTSFFENY